MKVLESAHKSDGIMAVLVFTVCLLIFATARANFYSAVLVNFDQTSDVLDQFEETPINDDPFSNLYSAMAEKLLADNACDACHSFYDTLKKPGMKQTLYQVCKKMAVANQNFCKILVKMIFRKKQTKTSVCEGFRFCQPKIEDDENSNTIDVDYDGIATRDAQTCDTCVKLVEVMKDEKLEGQMKKQCQVWKLRNPSNCTEFFDVLFKAVKAMPAKTACVEANFCSRKFESEFDNFYLLDNGPSNAEGEIDLKSLAVDLTADKNCEACQLFYDSLKKSNMKNTLVNECDQLEAASRRYCKKLVKSFFNPSKQKIETCKKVGLCPATLEIEVLSTNINELDYANEGYMNAETCQTCIGLVEAMKNKDVQESIRKKCEGNRYKPSCEEFYTTLFKLIDTNSPKQSCEMAKLCASKNLVTASTGGVIDEGVCSICNVVIEVVRNNASQTAIRDILNQICDQLPNPFNIVLKQVFDDSLAHLFKMLNSETTGKLCKSISLCDSEEFENFDNLDTLDLELEGGCKMCSSMVIELQRKDKQDAIKQTVEMIFEILPQPYNTIAKSKVIEYLNNFFEVINAGKPEQICGKYFKCLEMDEGYNVEILTIM